jgi:hypothetical protein
MPRGKVKKKRAREDGCKKSQDKGENGVKRAREKISEK